MNQNLRVNKTNFHMKGFTLGLALKQRRKATRKSPIGSEFTLFVDWFQLAEKECDWFSRQSTIFVDWLVLQTVVHTEL